MPAQVAATVGGSIGGTIAATKIETLNPEETWKAWAISCIVTSRLLLPFLTKLLSPCMDELDAEEQATRDEKLTTVGRDIGNTLQEGQNVAFGIAVIDDESIVVTRMATFVVSSSQKEMPWNVKARMMNLRKKLLTKYTEANSSAAALMTKRKKQKKRRNNKHRCGYSVKESRYSLSYASTIASSSIQLSLNSSPLMIRCAIDTLGSLCKGLLQRSIVFALAFVSSEHQLSHHSHSCGNE
jgi:hypothetical protein